MVTVMCTEIEQIGVKLKNRSPEEKTVHMNDVMRWIDRVRVTLKNLNQRFEAAENPEMPLSDEEWVKEMATRDEYDRKLNSLEDLHQSVCGVVEVEENFSNSETATSKDVGMTQLLEQLIKVQQLSANAAALQQLPPVKVRTFGGEPL